MSLSFHEILDFAIQAEEEAHRFYLDLAARARTEGMREVFEGFAAEEQGHKNKLVAVKAGHGALGSPARIQDLKLADYLEAPVPTGDMDYQEALVLAMKKEKAAFRLYSDLAARAEGALRDLLLGLAQEEAKHKLRFEIEYDEYVLKEN
ncbi:MAG: ferritin family protein [Deltaproteobacteria bacterium]|nr:ferritin family protein [Deltaproteobacteria bacterium]